MIPTKQQVFMEMYTPCHQAVAAASVPDAGPDVEVLNSLLAKLPSKQRESIVLFELSGFSFDEIRQLQGGTLSGVKSRLKRGREQLRIWLQDSSDHIVETDHNTFV